MSPEMVMSLAYQAMKLVLMIAAPLLLVALAVGLLVSLFQAATQINEMTLSFIPKILAVFFTIILAGQWMLGTLTDFTRELFHNLPMIIS
ncbi:flagellar biosynthesis protein FliQ [Kushneria phosphatilytica]|uniref:Flagellar biosynthetic protein FliQ n=1 Tax=Kushneria phosphatilytica TaxID=657387 RepID=A0A1S1P0K6_9GAMM|nr:flagellar biosynthesis protein FliQ [Kushneria phosphatilytica]OHV12015.1 EscS/YscS/HrcS family type III secretion system export apparatus protein [Kushneria phosphatilytica]QEL11207.1 flagellar biosynthesis protein FliQ [Kushneria phosphatilytica]